MRAKIWGARDLAPIFGPQNSSIGEAWYSYEENAVANGPLASLTLGELVSDLGAALMGDSYRPSDLTRRSADDPQNSEAASPTPYFPLLTKLIFTTDKLSVQVHPDDEYALAHEDGPGKTEMWYVVDAAPGACYCTRADQEAHSRSVAGRGSQRRDRELLELGSRAQGRCVSCLARNPAQYRSRT